MQELIFFDTSFNVVSVEFRVIDFHHLVFTTRLERATLDNTRLHVFYSLEGFLELGFPGLCSFSDKFLDAASFSGE